MNTLARKIGPILLLIAGLSGFSASGFSKDLEVFGYGLSRGEEGFAKAAADIEAMTMLAAQIKGTRFVYEKKDQKTLFAAHLRQVDISGAIKVSTQNWGEVWLVIKKITVRPKIPASAKFKEYEFKKVETQDFSMTLNQEEEKAVSFAMKELGLEKEKVSGMLFLINLSAEEGKDGNFLISGKILVAIEP